MTRAGVERSRGPRTGGSRLERLPDGRLYPSVLRVQELFAAQGYELAIRYVQLFECYRASWTNRQGVPMGAVVGADEREAAVFALAQRKEVAKERGDGRRA